MSLGSEAGARMETFNNGRHPNNSILKPNKERVPNLVHQGAAINHFEGIFAGIFITKFNENHIDGYARLVSYINTQSKTP